MKAELLSVGTELLLGQIVDTNAAFLARVLADHGVDLFFKQTVGDNRTRIQSALRTAVSRADLVLMTGGLGPTEDDLTVEVVADALGVPLVHDDRVAAHIRAFFEARRRPAPASVYKQALVPAGAEIIPNRRGTAPGVALTREGTLIVMMPGVPAEMEGMVDTFLIPWLRARTERDVIRSRVLRITGLGESAVEERVLDLLHTTAPTIAPLAKLGEVHLRVTAKGPADQVAALIDGGERAVRGRLGPLVFGVDDETLEAVTARLLADQGRTLAVAESCTGGLIADRLTNIPGSSTFFLQGAIVYSNQAKVALGVPGELLAQHGAVSAPVAQAMAEAVRGWAGSNLGLAVTGIAGPTGATPEKPVGLVYIALAGTPGGPAVQEWRFGSEAGRRGIKYLTSQAALNLVRLTLLGAPAASP